MIQRRRFSLAFAVAAALGLAAPAFADCGSDMQKLAQDRNVDLQRVNDFAKAAHGKPLDPAAFCVKTVGLLHADDAIEGLKTSHAKNAALNAKACTVAEKIKKMKEQAAQGGGGGPQAQPVPAGPL